MFIPIFVWFEGFGGMEPAGVLTPLDAIIHWPTSHCLYTYSCCLLRVSKAWFPRIRTAVARHLTAPVPKSWALPPPKSLDNPFAQALVQRSRHCRHQRCSICPTRDLVWPEEVIGPAPSHAGGSPHSSSSALAQCAAYSPSISPPLNASSSELPHARAPSIWPRSHLAMQRRRATRTARNGFIHPIQGGRAVRIFQEYATAEMTPSPAPPNQTLMKNLPTKHWWKKDCPIPSGTSLKPNQCI